MPERVIRGEVIKLGDYVNTDVISPGRWMREGLEVLRLHTMEAIRPEFYKEVKPGDIIVGGRNFGCGSHREAATAIMKVLRVSAIIADSVARLYYRNCIAFGIPVISIEGVSRLVEAGDTIEIIMGKDQIALKNVSRGGEMSAPSMSYTMSKVLEAGGVYELLKQRLREES